MEDFKKAFRLTEECELKESNSIIFPKEKVLISPFFEPRNMGQKRIENTVSHIQNLLETKKSN